MTWIKQSTASTVVLGPFVDSTDGVTAETGLTISQADIRLSKNGGAFAQTNNVAGATHMENGYYSVPLDTTDSNTLGRLRVAVSEAGALPVWRDFMVVPANVWDSFFGADKLQVHVDEMTNDIITAAVIANNAIDATAIASDAITAAKIADGAIDAATFAAGAITASAIATNAIDADALAADAVTEIQSGLSTLDAAGVRTAVGLASANLDTQLADLPTNAELATSQAAADDATLAAIAALNNLSAAQVNAEVDTALADYDAPTKAELDAAVAPLATQTSVNDLPTNAELTTALASADDATLAAIAALNDLSAAEVNAEVLDVLATDTFAEPSAVPAATSTLKDKINWLFILARNKITQTATTQLVRNDADNATVGTSTVSDDGTTATRGEFS